MPLSSPTYWIPCAGFLLAHREVEFRRILHSFRGEHGVGVQGDFGVKNVNSIVGGQNQGLISTSASP